jgi:hypothetical protein
MIRSAFSLGVLGVSALALAACDPPRPRHDHGWGHHDSHEALKVITRLDCPDEQGDLTRKAAAADGKSCDYAGEDGAVVSLQLAALNGNDAGPVLDPLGDQLRAELPTLPATPTPPGSGKSGKDDKVDIDLPGVHIHADGDKASVDAGGDSGHGGVRVNADDHGAEVHIEDQNGPGVRKMMILTSDTPGPHGYQVVAYEARGPVGGPIVVATVKAKDHDHDDLMRDVRDLVRHNVGG